MVFFDHQRVGGCHKIEILTGKDALDFLRSGRGVDKGHCSPLKSGFFSGLFAKMDDATPPQCPSSKKMLSSPRKQRKSYKPQHVAPPVESSLFSAIPQNSENTSSDRSVTNTVKGRRKQRQKPHHGTNVCKNLACKAVLHAGVSFCRRCSCHICKGFDENKDPSLWITCEADSCGLSCHVECALGKKVAGVLITSGCSFSLDGDYFCQPCGQISSLIGLWKRQLLAAKEARRVDILCVRLFLSYKLLMGTVKYKAAHVVIEEAVQKLDTELHLFGTTKLERCLVNRLSCSANIQNLINRALDGMEAQTRGAQALDLPSQKGLCALQFEDVCSSSVVVVAMNKQPCDRVKGYKIWHRRATDPAYPNLPTCIIESPLSKALISGLQPLMSYAFKLVHFSSTADGEELEAECCTQGVVPIHETCTAQDTSDCTQGVGETKVGNEDDHKTAANICSPAPGFQCIETETLEHHRKGVEVPSNMTDKSNTSDVHEAKDNFSSENMPVGPADTNGNLKSMRSDACGTPPTLGAQKDKEDMFHSRSWTIEVRNGACGNPPLTLETEKEEDSSQHRSLTMDVVPQCWAMEPQTGQVSLPGKKEFGGVKRAHLYVDCSSDLEFPIKAIRWLERAGHLEEEFRMKFLTWYGLRASQHERQVVNVFIGTLQDSPAGLAAQLMDSFGDIIGSKRHRLS